ncbi:MAG: prolipoprotein diacylglyceryl transferase, partial [Deltaproteobacteria bacterium]|nr:prolipoprotein diacylglyceryl transferase [Deltaproteobacteria bacterium]
MWPYDLRLGPFVTNAYGIATALAVLVAYYSLRWSAPRAGLAAREARDLAFWLIVLGLIGARLFFVAFHFELFRGRLHRALYYFEGGLMFQGGFLLAFLGALRLARRRRIPFWRAADALAPALALGQGLGRIGCFLEGCCYGKRVPDGFPWGVVFPPESAAPSGAPLYPT